MTGVAQRLQQRLGIAQAQPVADRFPLPAYVSGFPEIDFQGQHVGRQDPVGFEQADHQGNGNDQRDDLHELAQDAGQQHKRQKRGDCGHHRGGDRGENLPEGLR